MAGTTRIGFTFPTSVAWIMQSPSPLRASRKRGMRSSLEQRESSSPFDASDTLVVDRSTLTLLEHINLNIPNHDHIDFYFKVLGCGIDPRKASNLKPSSTGSTSTSTGSTSTGTTSTSPKKTLWANLGASQFHLPYGPTGQAIPGRIGLYYYQSLEGLKKRIQEYPSCFATFELGHDKNTNREYVQLTDHYGNVFVCRSKQEKHSDDRNLRQPIVAKNDTVQWDVIATTYGLDGETECRGIEYVEFFCPPGSASKIALFYESLLDATTNVVATTATTDTNAALSIAIIAIGDIYASGRSTQSLLFRETLEEIPPYDGHHIALYVGENSADFEQAFRNAQISDVLWKNPRFSDQVDNLDEARKEQQFRFKDILDIQTGECIMELEHELRSINHPSWPEVKQ